MTGKINFLEFSTFTFLLFYFLNEKRGILHHLAFLLYVSFVMLSSQRFRDWEDLLSREFVKSIINFGEICVKCVSAFPILYLYLVVCHQCLMAGGVRLGFVSSLFVIKKKSSRALRSRLFGHWVDNHKPQGNLHIEERY